MTPDPVTSKGEPCVARAALGMSAGPGRARSARPTRRLLSLALFAVLLPACAQAQARRTVAILVWPGAELLDFTGPAEVFAAAGRHRYFDVRVVGLDAKPVRTQGSVTVVPDFTLRNAPPADILVIPGGNMRPVEGNAAAIAWVRDQASRATVVLSVCTGSFLLAEAGLLDGLKATTHHFAYEALARQYPKIEVLRTERFVDNGKFITAGGVSAGIDAALHVVERLHGPEAAAWTAREWMEYRGYPLPAPDRTASPATGAATSPSR